MQFFCVHLVHLSSKTSLHVAMLGKRLNGLPGAVCVWREGGEGGNGLHHRVMETEEASHGGNSVPLQHR